jgi:hypothetical protein
MATTPPLFLPVLANDSSCVNLARAHHNAATMWIFIGASAILAENPNTFRMANVQAMLHLFCQEVYMEIATLNDPKIVIILL